MEDLAEASVWFCRRFGKAFDGINPISTFPDGDRPYDSLLGLSKVGSVNCCSNLVSGCSSLIC